MNRQTTLAGLVLILVGCSSGGGSSHASGGSFGAPAARTPNPGALLRTATPAASTLPPSKPQSAVPAENNPAGDIPDHLAFLRTINATGRYSFTHPEGWAETTSDSSVTATDKLNGVQVQLGTLTTAPTVSSANQQDIPALTRSQPAFELSHVTAVTEPGGSGVRIVYRRNSAPDPVTGRQYRDEVQRYELTARGREIIMELFGPVGSDNVDAYQTMITSLTVS